MKKKIEKICQIANHQLRKMSKSLDDDPDTLQLWFIGWIQASESKKKEGDPSLADLYRWIASHKTEKYEIYCGEFFQILSNYESFLPEKISEKIAEDTLDELLIPAKQAYIEALVHWRKNKK